MQKLFSHLITGTSIVVTAFFCLAILALGYMAGWFLFEFGAVSFLILCGILLVLGGIQAGFETLITAPFRLFKKTAPDPELTQDEAEAGRIAGRRIGQLMLACFATGFILSAIRATLGGTA